LADRILITGGGGFIGRFVAKALLERGHHVCALDCLLEQVHGADCGYADLSQDVELIIGDIRDPIAVSHAVSHVDKVVHLAAEVGVGQSMYEIERYISVNDLGTAVLLQQLIRRPVQRIVVASSMSIYGEGLYATVEGDLVDNAVRFATGISWDPLDGVGRGLLPIPTPESKRPQLASVYALTKYTQEQLVLTASRAYGMECAALRLFNVYGPGQALSNPYTGVLAIFASRLLNGRPPLIFEDGQQQRDFVHVEDVADAFVLALEHPNASGNVYNIGSGVHRSIESVATLLASAMDRGGLEPEFAGIARAGDIRHCFADVTKARDELGFVPTHKFEDGLIQLANWVAKRSAQDRVAQAREELELRGLVS
jgi:dTDP-L-rhamnose 4-epimerase